MSDHKNGHSEAAHVRIYMLVFGALMVLTIVTVLVSYLHLPRTLGLLIGLAIATLKASLVAAFFMHLKWERPLIYGLLGATVLAMITLMALPIIDGRGIEDRLLHPEAAEHAASDHAAAEAHH